ncbi:MAG TPA: hypothetical protein VLD19_15305, partial [Chitinophagaceae bacterium]|nr:hypothetical protein [Chitinophagaceae bacterium]
MKKAGTPLIISSFLFVFPPVHLMSQKQTLNEIKWSVAALLPPLPGQALQPGLAGSVSGITGHVLLVAGGANFPQGLPWNGAIKQYHNDIYLFEKSNGTLKAPAAPAKEKLPEAVAYGGCVSTPAGIVYAGGENEHGITNKVYRLQYEAGVVSIQPLASLPLPLTNLAAAYYDNKLFIAGGETKEGPSNKC